MVGGVTLGLVDVTTFTGGAYGLFIPCFLPKFLPRESFLQKSLKKNSKGYLAKNGVPVSTNWTFLKLQGPNSEVNFSSETKPHNPGVVVFKTACSESVGKGASSLSSLWSIKRATVLPITSTTNHPFFEFRSHGLIPVGCPAFGPCHRNIHFWIFEARKGAKSSGPNKAVIFFQSSFFRAFKLLGGVASKGWLGSSISNFTRLHGIYQVAPENHRFWAVLHPYLLNFTMKSLKKNCS